MFYSKPYSIIRDLYNRILLPVNCAKNNVEIINDNKLFI